MLRLRTPSETQPYKPDGQGASVVNAGKVGQVFEGPRVAHWEEQGGQRTFGAGAETACGDGLRMLLLEKVLGCLSSHVRRLHFSRLRFII